MKTQLKQFIHKTHIDNNRSRIVALFITGVLFCLSVPSAPVYAQAEEVEKLKQSLTNKLQELSSASLERKQTISKELSQGNQKWLGAYVDLLSTPTEESIPAMQAIIWAIGGQFPKGPGPNSWTSRPAKKRGTKEGKEPLQEEKTELDWLSAIIQLREDDFFQAAKELQTVPNSVKKQTPENSLLFKQTQANMIFKIALLRGLENMAKQGQIEAAKPVFDFAFTQKGVFRDECGRILRAMGSSAIPELIRRGHELKKDKAAQTRYANFQLDFSDYLSPAKAIRSTANPQLRATILRVLGEVQEREAVEPILSEYMKTTNPLIKEAARWAFLQFVSGKEPPKSPCRRRKLPGGKEESVCKEDFLDFRKLAKERCIDVLREIPGFKIKPQALKNMTAAELAEQVFSYYDRFQDQSLEQKFSQGQDALKENDIKRAISIFSWILLNQPDHPKRKEMAQTFAEYGEQLAQQGEAQKNQVLISQGLGYLRKALVLAALPNQKRIQARIHFLDGKQAQTYGADGIADFQLALQADPTYAEAQNELNRLGKSPLPLK